jgi:hypothetical protein
MRKIFAIIVLLHLCLIWGCIHQTHKERKEDTSVNQTIDDTELVNNKLPFSKNLMVEIQNSISDTNHRMQSQIYGLWFAKTDGDCCIAISTANFYHSRVAEGFYLIDDKLIVYYGTDVTCSAILEGKIDSFINRKDIIKCNIMDLIDTALLSKECPTGFSDENSDEALYTLFDPYGKIFKVHNCDSLELIYEGCL